MKLIIWVILRLIQIYKCMSIQEDKVKREVQDGKVEFFDVADIPVEVFEAICAAFPDQGGTVEELQDKWVLTSCTRHLGLFVILGCLCHLFEQSVLWAVYWAEYMWDMYAAN